ncbi:MAG TPA: cobaltochelatase subunit CobN [Stellaceae bacterium]|nr:cobaltochelatase subunit CobN [Stellaceae bacterium]
MHLLATEPGTIADGSAAIDLAQTPADLVVLSAADTELALIAAAQARRVAEAPGAPSLRLASVLRLRHNFSVDLYMETVACARLVVARLLGGSGYWPYGVERLAETCRRAGIPLALLPGDDKPDPELFALSTLPQDAADRLWRYLVEGGPTNAGNFLRYAAALIGHETAWAEPAPLLRAGFYWPGRRVAALADIAAQWRGEGAVAAVVFYRALVQSGNTAPVDALVEALSARGLKPLPIFVQSLKEGEARALLEEAFRAAPPSVILNATGFSVRAGGAADPLAAADCPVLQAVFSGGDEAAWRQGTRGLNPRDLAMNVVLPEIDGRILARAVSFKAPLGRDPLTEADLVGWRPVADRVAFVADLARNWTRLRSKGVGERRLAIILANYPNRDGRIGNGVGLDTPASALAILRALAAAGYRLGPFPDSPQELIERLLAGPTNARPSAPYEEALSFAQYSAFFGTLPAAVQTAVTARWGAAERDPFFRPGSVDCGRFALPGFSIGNVAVLVQPARGYNIDPQGSYHDPALVPPHSYFAAYAWLFEDFRADAIVHLGKHGTLEWLPGKALALSAECFPESAFAPLPHLYPFIVNDPGEGSQAKRRTAAVIIDHLTPPLTRAGSYGALAELERLIDEFSEARRQDPRRVEPLAAAIIERARTAGIDRDCGIADGEDREAALSKLDGFLCELKELQIRDGLHVFGTSPDGARLDALLVAIARAERGTRPQDASLTRALAEDLGLAPGDDIERPEDLALRLVAREIVPRPEWRKSRSVLDWIEGVLRPAVADSGAAETAALLAGLDGRFVAPGPAGAPSRGRPDVLPTGRNFHSLDTRAVPTEAAWQLGWKSASLLVERYAQEHGEYPLRVALSAWGTANMRTGGDDIAQALALLGVRPLWERASGRVTGFEILPASVLDRPRVDVTLRVSGFFRDAFPGLIDLFDSAARAVAALAEPPDVNPLAARVAEDARALEAAGVAPGEARLRAGYRVFGSRPGAYGAGLQTPIDEGIWEGEEDLAEAYLAWSHWAYGAGSEGQAERGMLERRLAATQAVLHNQDNREHDLLDSDDYYQFEGGLALVVRCLSGKAPAVYHNDHSRPEAPRIRSLSEELGLVVRGRAANPRWIRGIMRHGYKGAAEIAATVDYLYAFAATSRAVEDAHFEALYEAYILDDEVREFIAAHNAPALVETSRRFLEAIERGLWRPRRNSAAESLREWSRG